MLEENPPVLDVGLIQGTSASASGDAAYADPGSGWLADSSAAEYSPTALLDALLEEKLGAIASPELPWPAASPSPETLDADVPEMTQRFAQPDIVAPEPAEQDFLAAGLGAPEPAFRRAYDDVALRHIPVTAPNCPHRPKWPRALASRRFRSGNTSP